jgi:hypothetical protein
LAGRHLTATIAGGSDNDIGVWALRAFIGGGEENTLDDYATHAFLGGGERNWIGASARHATIGGGFENAIGTNASFAIIPGGSQNEATGVYSFAAGHRAKARAPGAFVWGDSTGADVASANANSWTVRASGGVTFFTDTNLTSGAVLSTGSGSWSSLSDRAAKEDLQPVDGRAVLEQLARLPLSTWRYKAQAPGVRHVGPMAQDFHAVFGVGEEERHISSVDADGVALAAIQGLNEIVQEQKAELKAKDVQITELEKRLAALERLLRVQIQK